MFHPSATGAAAPILAALMLAACSVNTETDVVVPDVTVPVDACNSAAYQQFVGQRSPAITLPPGTDFRHYRTGDMLTMDFAETRLNFEYDRSGTLIRVSCG